MKPRNPYAVLKAEAVEWIAKVHRRRRVQMWRYPAKDIRTAQWNLFDLAERVRAADQLGFDVALRWVDDGLRVEYVERLPSTPYWY